MIEVLSKVPLLNLVRNVLVGCSNNPNVHVNILVTAHAGKFVLLQNSQHLSLSREAHITHLIQKQSTAVCLFKFTFVLFDCRCEGSLLVSKEFTLNKFTWNSSAVHLNKRHSGSWALLMQPSGNQLLTRTVRSRHQNSCICRSHLLYHLLNFQYGRRVAHNLLNSRICNLFLQSLILFHHIRMGGSVLYRNKYSVEIQWLGNEIVCTSLNAAHCRIYICVTRYHHNGRLNSLFYKLF